MASGTGMLGLPKPGMGGTARDVQAWRSAVQAKGHEAEERLDHGKPGDYV